MVVFKDNVQVIELSRSENEIANDTIILFDAIKNLLESRIDRVLFESANFHPHFKEQLTITSKNKYLIMERLEAQYKLSDTILKTELKLNVFWDSFWSMCMQYRRCKVRDILKQYFNDMVRIADIQHIDLNIACLLKITAPDLSVYLFPEKYWTNMGYTPSKRINSLIHQIREDIESLSSSFFQKNMITFIFNNHIQFVYGRQLNLPLDKRIVCSLLSCFYRVKVSYVVQNILISTSDNMRYSLPCAI